MEDEAAQRALATAQAPVVGAEQVDCVAGDHREAGSHLPAGRCDEMARAIAREDRVGCGLGGTAVDDGQIGRFDRAAVDAVCDRTVDRFAQRPGLGEVAP